MNIFLEKQKREVNQEFDQKQVEEKFGWMAEFREDIKEWGKLLDINNNNRELRENARLVC